MVPTMLNGAWLAARGPSTSFVPRRTPDGSFTLAKTVSEFQMPFASTSNANALSLALNSKRRWRMTSDCTSHLTLSFISHDCTSCGDVWSKPPKQHSPGLDGCPTPCAVPRHVLKCGSQRVPRWWLCALRARLAVHLGERCLL